jgi:hypothetical protein
VTNLELAIVCSCHEYGIFAGGLIRTSLFPSEMSVDILADAAKCNFQDIPFGKMTESTSSLVDHPIAKATLSSITVAMITL